MLAGGCTPKWAQLGRKSQFTGSFWRQPELTVPTVLLSEKYSCTDHVSTIAKHFPYGTSVCSSLTSENFGQNRYRKSAQVIWSAPYSTCTYYKAGAHCCCGVCFFASHARVGISGIGCSGVHAKMLTSGSQNYGVRVRSSWLAFELCWPQSYFIFFDQRNGKGHIEYQKGTDGLYILSCTL